MDALIPLPGLLPASFRGLFFDMPDARTEAGRRVAETLFPGVDRAAYDDFGVLPQVVTVEGLILGDDYALRGQAMLAAFEQAGPGTLIHPWLGAMTVIIEEPGEVAFSAGELRCVRISARFKRVRAGAAPTIVSTLARVASAVSTLVGVAAALAGAPGRREVSRVSALATARSARIVSAAWQAALQPGAGLGGAAAGAVSATIAAFHPSSPGGYAFGLSGMGSALIEALAAPPPAVSPAAGAPPPEARLDPRIGFRLALDLVSAFSAEVDRAPAAADRAMLAAAGADALARAASLATAGTYPSRDEALAARAAFTDGRLALEISIEILAEGRYGAEVSTLRQALAEIGAAVAADINEAIGRLPAVVVLTIDRPVSAMLIAQHLYGDDPATVEAGYRAIIARTPHRHPAMLPAGRVEALR